MIEGLRLLYQDAGVTHLVEGVTASIERHAAADVIGSRVGLAVYDGAGKLLTTCQGLPGDEVLHDPGLDIQFWSSQRGWFVLLPTERAVQGFKGGRWAGPRGCMQAGGGAGITAVHLAGPQRRAAAQLVGVAGAQACGSKAGRAGVLGPRAALAAAGCRSAWHRCRGAPAHPAAAACRPRTPLAGLLRLWRLVEQLGEIRGPPALRHLSASPTRGQPPPAGVARLPSALLTGAAPAQPPGLPAPLAALPRSGSVPEPSWMEALAGRGPAASPPHASAPSSPGRGTLGLTAGQLVDALRSAPAAPGLEAHAGSSTPTPMDCGMAPAADAPRPHQQPGFGPCVPQQPLPGWAAAAEQQQQGSAGSAQTWHGIALPFATAAAQAGGHTAQTQLPWPGSPPRGAPGPQQPAAPAPSGSKCAGGSPPAAPPSVLLQQLLMGRQASVASTAGGRSSPKSALQPAFTMASTLSSTLSSALSTSLPAGLQPAPSELAQQAQQGQIPRA